jgi:prepilin-type N-terminal cleavage/methylation domain-containing protein
MVQRVRDNDGFTLIELILIIIILGILSTVVIAKYQEMDIEAKKSSCRSALGGLRSGISLYYSNKAVSTGVASWPEIDTLRTVGAVMEFSIPRNPFQLDSNAPDSIVEGTTPGVVVGTRGGWAYKPSTGEIWPNTHTILSGDGCSGSEDIGENNW